MLVEGGWVIGSSRSGRRNDKIFSVFNKRPLKRPMANSPITYIKMRPQPYSFVSGTGFVSQRRTLSPLYQALVGMNRRRHVNDIHDKYPEKKRPFVGNRRSDFESDNYNDETKDILDDVKLEELSKVANVYRPKINFVSNARPHSIFHWAPITTTTSTTTPTTTTTMTTTTTTTTTTTGSSSSPITWLGRVLMNGLPSSLSHFESPFSPLYWYNSLSDLASRGQSRAFFT